jgi:hypothetical protein
MIKLHKINFYLRLKKIEYKKPQQASELAAAADRPGLEPGLF